MPAVVEARVHRASGVVELALTNGVPVFVRPMPGTGRVVMIVSVLGAEAMERPEQWGITRIGAAGWRPSGEAGPSARWRAWPGPDGLSLRLSGSAESVRLGVESVARALADPAVDAEALSAWRQRGALRRRGSFVGGERLVADAVLDVMAPGLGLSRPAVGPGEAAEPEVVRSWLRWCVRSLPIEVSVVGEITPAQAAEWVAPPLAALPARPAEALAALEARRSVAMAEARSTVVGHGGLPPGRAYAVVALPGPALRDLDELRACTIGARIAHDRLGPALRSAGIEAGASGVLCLPGRVYRASGIVLASVRVEGNADDARRAQDVALAVLADLAARGPDDAEVRRLADGAADEAERRLGDADYWAMILSGSRFHGVAPDELMGAPGRYRSMTAASVAAALGRRVDPGRAYRVVVQPAAAEGGEAPAGVP
ncbi:MAG: insulinase family protein [Phycisphaerae bacterium]|nr:insulinase family protein [Phycisphaerae bacterium]